MSDAPPYRVGRGKPPPEHRWPKVTSGNPGGRPKGSKNRTEPKGFRESKKELEAIFLEEAARTLRVIEGGKATQMSAARAIVRTLAMSAFKGNRIAGKDFLNTVFRIEAERHKESLKFIDDMARYKEIVGRTFTEAKRMGRPEPDDTPHPDDIIFDPYLQEVRVDGPLTPEEKTAMEELLAQRDKMQDSVSFFGERFAQAIGAKARKNMLLAWHQAQDHYDRINDSLPARYRKTLTDRSYADGATRDGQFAGDWEPPQRLPKEEN